MFLLICHICLLLSNLSTVISFSFIKRAFHFYLNLNLKLLKMASNSAKDKKSSRGPSPEEIINGFQTLRADQRALSGKLSEFELDLNEHRMVIETLKNVNEDRKCFRLVGGVLTERKVKDVLPVLISNQDRLKEFIEKLNEQIAKKGQEINEYREKHNIRFRGLDNVKQEEQPVSTSSESRGNVLVS